MLQNDALATAAHLHVLLRRKTGRVTDTEWMASNPEYAQAIARFAREKAREEGQADLLPLAERLEALVVMPQRRKVLPAVEAVSAPVPLAAMSGDASTRYVGRLR